MDEPVGERVQAGWRRLIEQIRTKASVPSASSLTYAAMNVSMAIAAYADERRAQVSARMRA
jgi:hypothetical protein